jgi:hypothetical protein
MTVRKAILAISSVTFLAQLGCVTRPIVDPRLSGARQDVKSFPQSLDKEVDLLFIVDDSRSMIGEQQSLARNFPQLINALRSDKLGPVTPGATCEPGDTSGCKIPDVRIGVISPNLGAGPYDFVDTCQTVGGLGGKLQNQAREAGCTPPDDAWISYVGRDEGTGAENVTNVRSGSTDPIDRVSEAFACIARLGSEDCGFEQQLEAAKKALDPVANVNPDFLRNEALLAVVFITDEDDCSAARTEIYNTKDFSFGPANFRCFEYGISCAGTPGDQIREPGPRDSCAPAGNYLKPVTASQAGASGESYEEFFKRLKTRSDGRPRPGRVIMSALAGPPTPVAVGIAEGVGPQGGPGPDLKPSCEGRRSAEDDSPEAFPAIRINALMRSFSAADNEVPGKLTKICPENEGDDNFRRALSEIGDRIRAALGRQCITAPLFRQGGGLACAANEDLGGGLRCPSPGCLAEVDCQVEEGTDESQPQTVERCSVDLFNDLAAESCSGATCPCWRIVPSDACTPAKDGSPYALEVLRPAGTEAKKGTFADVTCNASRNAWGSEGLFTTLDEDEDGTPERICQ